MRSVSVLLRFLLTSFHSYDFQMQIPCLKSILPAKFMGRGTTKKKKKTHPVFSIISKILKIRNCIGKKGFNSLVVHAVFLFNPLMIQ